MANTISGKSSSHARSSLLQSPLNAVKPRDISSLDDITFSDSVDGRSKCRPWRFLVIGDVHLRKDYRTRYMEMIEAILVAAKAEKPDEIVFTGDVLDRWANINMYCQRDAIDMFNRCAEIAPVTVLKGNHDAPSNNDYMTDLHPFTAVTNPRITIVWKTRWQWREELAGWVIYVPYVPRGRYAEALKCGPDGNSPPLIECCVAFNHQEIKGCLMDRQVSKHGDVLPLDHPPCIAGHIHESQQVGEVFYVGTPVQITYAESEDKGIWLITVPPMTLGDKRSVTKKFVPLYCTVIKTSYVDYEGLQSWNLADQNPDIHGRPTQWWIIVRDNPVKFASLQLLPHYNRLRALGVTVTTQPMITDNDSNTINHTTTHPITYVESLYEHWTAHADHSRMLRDILTK